MHTGSADELREQERRSREIGRQIAELLNEAARIAPGAVHANVTGLGFTIRGAGGGFRADTR
ncbi:hypothetical protein M2155_000622 [Streptomyces sp. SAI-119]|uniref:hypothetical protein n=1 Tax=Streptomyces sp. SAI-119 TaxID=2940541 RepID=UPI0024761F10|nr:hypothetical protein [Streptomyces sp. SAI-119]MDH6448214.1 hypothetical protein [Streptomyces sp. SAI-119]